MNIGTQASKCLLNEIERFPFYIKACNLLDHEELFRMMLVWMLPWHWRSFPWIPWPYSFLAWYHIRYVSRFRKHPLVLSPLLQRSHKCNFLLRWCTPWRDTIKRIVLHSSYQVFTRLYVLPKQSLKRIVLHSSYKVFTRLYVLPKQSLNVSISCMCMVIWWSNPYTR